MKVRRPVKRRYVTRGGRGGFPWAEAHGYLQGIATRCRRWGIAGRNPEGIVSTSPGLARSAYPGNQRPNVTTPTGLRRGRGRGQEGRNPVGVETISRPLTQGSACRATLGWRTESRWDSARAVA